MIKGEGTQDNPWYVGYASLVELIDINDVDTNQPAILLQFILEGELMGLAFSMSDMKEIYDKLSEIFGNQSS